MCLNKVTKIYAKTCNKLKDPGYDQLIVGYKIMKYRLNRYSGEKIYQDYYQSIDREIGKEYKSRRVYLNKYIWHNSYTKNRNMYVSGFHIIKRLKDAKKYCNQFKDYNENLVIVECHGWNITSMGIDSNMNVYVTDNMRLIKEVK